MTERRDLVPFTGGLIPLGLDERPLLAAKQQQELLDATRLYARDHRIPLTTDTSGRVMGVLVDSLQRTIIASKHPPLTSKDRIRPLIRQGLEIREGLRSQAEESLKFTSSHQGTDQELVGPFALPSSLIQTAHMESRNFFLTPRIEATQQVVQLVSHRHPLIDKFARAAITHLPAELEGVNLEKFPDAADRVKLIRNMIASFVFRGNLSPLIPTSDLKDFVLASKDLVNPFNSEMQEALIVAIGTLNTDERPYLESLFRQTVTLFEVYQDVPDENNPRAFDNFYRQFARDLLLLHPALEEKQIVTVPTKVAPDSVHIWQEGARFGPNIIPRTEMLALAIRQAEAKGDRLNADRFQEAIKLWQWFERTKPAHEQRIRKAEDELQLRQELLRNLDDPSFPLPKEAYFAIHVDQEKARGMTRMRRKEAEGIQRTISEHEALQIRTKEYERELKERFGENWPYLVPISRDVFLQRLQDQERSLIGQLGAMITRLNKVEDLLHLDFLWNKENDLKYGFLSREQPDQWLEKELEKTQALQRSPVQFSEAETVDLLGHLFRYFQYKPKSQYLSKELQTFQKFWEDTHDKLWGNPGLQRDRDFWLSLIPQILSQRAGLLKYTQGALQRKYQIPSEVQEAREQIRKFQDPMQPLPEGAVWTNRNARDYILETNLVSVPQVEQEEVETLIKTAQETQFLLANISARRLPDSVEGKQHFVSRLEARMAQLRSEIAHKQSLVEVGIRVSGLSDLKRDLDNLARLRDCLNSPIVPLPEGEGLPIKQFVRIWRRRAELTYATYLQEETEEESLRAQQDYEGLSRSVFKRRLTGEVEVKINALKKLTDRDIEQELVERMRHLNLVFDMPP